MKRLAPFVGLVSGALLLASCHEGFEDTVWEDDGKTRTLSIFDTGAAWEERSVDTSTGERVVQDGLRFEGVFTEGDESLTAEVRCVSAENASLAEPCDSSVVRELDCVLDEVDDAHLVCKVGKESIDVYRHHSTRARSQSNAEE